MRISELIELLQQALNEEGDIKVYLHVPTDEYDFHFGATDTDIGYDSEGEARFIIYY